MFLLSVLHSEQRSGPSRLLKSDEAINETMKLAWHSGRHEQDEALQM